MTRSLNRSLAMLGILTALSLGTLPVQPAQAATGDITEADINKFLKFVTEKALQYVLLIAAIFIILAGYLYITSLGNTQKVEQAKQMLLYTLIGVLVVMGAYLALGAILSQVATTGT